MANVVIKEGYWLYMVEAENMAQPQLWIGKELPAELDGYSVTTMINCYLKEHHWRRYTLASGTEFYGPEVGGSPICRDTLIEKIWEWLEKVYEFQVFEDWSSLMHESD